MALRIIYQCKEYRFTKRLIEGYFAKLLLFKILRLNPELDYVPGIAARQVFIESRV